MEKVDLLKQIGFSDEFLKQLEDFQNNVVDLQVTDVSEQSILQNGFDTDTLRIEKTLTNSAQEIHFKTK